MKIVLSQLAKWPPTTTTVIGAGIIAGVADYILTGNIAEAVFIAGLFKIVCPEDAGAVDKLDAVLGALPGALDKTPGAKS